MRTFKAVLSGFLVTSALILAAEWAYGLLAAPGLLAALLALVYTSGAIVAGAYVASKVHDSAETIGGFAFTQAFFGFGLIHEFWNPGPSWYGAAAVLLVIPCALIGLALARKSGRARMARAA